MSDVDRAEYLITEEQVDRLAARLNGTSDGLDYALEDVLGAEFADATLLPDWALERLDNTVLLCEGCDHWHDASGIEDGFCGDCQ